jgi:hypothetical protein
VERDVVDQELARIADRRVHAGDRVRDRGQVLGLRALGRHPDHFHFERAARLEHLAQRHAVERGEEPERFGVEHRRPRRDERPGAAPADQHALRDERLNARAHARAADAQFFRQLALGAQPAARRQPAVQDQTAYVLHHLIGRQVPPPDLDEFGFPARQTATL